MPLPSTTQGQTSLGVIRYTNRAESVGPSSTTVELKVVQGRKCPSQKTEANIKSTLGGELLGFVEEIKRFEDVLSRGRKP